MHGTSPTDEQLLSARDAASFELFYCRHVDPLLGFFARRTRDPELAADLAAETFAAVLARRPRARGGVRGGARASRPLPAGGGSRGRLAVRHRDEEAGRRATPRLRGTARA